MKLWELPMKYLTSRIITEFTDILLSEELSRETINLFRILLGTGLTNAKEKHKMVYVVVLKENNLDVALIKESIINKCKSELKEYEVPKYLRIVDELPYTQNGKYDFRLLENQGNDYVCSLNKG